MIGLINRQHYGRKILEDRPRKRQKSVHTHARRVRVGVTGYYPQKLFYNELPQMMQCHRHPITSMCFDGVKSRKQHLVSVTLHDGSITISNPGSSATSVPQYFNSKNDDVLSSWYGHENSIFDCSWYNDGMSLATASSDGTCRLWDASTSKEIASFACPSGDKILSFKTIRPCPGNQNLFVSSGRDGSVLLWDCRQLARHSFSMNGGRNKKSCQKPVQHILDGHCVFTSTSNKRSSSKSLFSANSSQFQNGVSQAIFGNSDGTQIFSSGASDGLIKCWDMRRIYHSKLFKTRKRKSVGRKMPTPLMVIQEPGVLPLSKDKKEWLGMNALFVDGGSVGNTVKKYDHGSPLQAKSSNDTIGTARKSPTNFNFLRKNHGISSIDLDPTFSKLLVSYLNQSIHVYDLAGCVENNVVMKYNGYSYCCKSYYAKSSWSSDGEYILSGASNGMGYVWKYSSKQWNGSTVPSFVFPVSDNENDDVSNVVAAKTGNAMKDLSLVATSKISSTPSQEIKFWSMYDSEYTRR